MAGVKPVDFGVRQIMLEHLSPFSSRKSETASQEEGGPPE
jgi:hypothetical protein